MNGGIIGSTGDAWRVVESLAGWAWRAGWQGALLAAGVAAVLWLAGRRLSPAWRFALWGLVLVRMAMPALIEQRATAARPAVSVGAARPGAIAISTEEAQRAVDALAAVRPTATGEKAVATAQTLPAASAERWRTLAARGWGRVRSPLIGVWLGGMAVLSVWVAGGYVRLRRIVAALPRVEDRRVVGVVEACCREMGVRRAPTVRLLEAGGAPALVGFVRPAILLPPAVVSELGDEELRMIVLHELAHARRRDVLWNWLATAVTVVQWPNPAAWGAAWRMKAEREVACDEMVLRVARTGAGAAYARTILRLIEALSGGGAVAAAGGAVGILEGKAQIKRRLVMIARFDSTAATATKRRWSAMAAALGIAVGALALSGVTRAADEKPAPAAPAKKVDARSTDAKSAAGDPAGAEGQAGAGSAAVAGFADSSGATGAGTGKPATPAKGTPGLLGQAGAFPSGEAEDPANVRTAEKLRKSIKGVDFNGQGLADVLEFMRDASGVDILAEWGALEEAGITRDQPVTIRLREPAPVDAVLTLIFRSMGDQVTYQVERGVVIVGPGNRKSASVTRAYDVSDLVAAHSDEAGAGPVRGGGGGGGGVGPRGGPFGGGGGGGGGGANIDDVSQLIQLITSTVEPQSWTQAGGSEASIGVFKNKLVIKAPDRTHKEVANLLEMLRDRPAPKGEGRPK